MAQTLVISEATRLKTFVKNPDISLLTDFLGAILPNTQKYHAIRICDAAEQNVRLGHYPVAWEITRKQRNAYSESLFRTLKYCPQWPQAGFASLDAARAWVRDFMRWYNNEHRHSRIRFVTPSERHRKLDHQILARRHERTNKRERRARNAGPGKRETG